MNKVILVGRITKDPEVKTTQSQVAVCSFTLAVDRKFKTPTGERQSDFLSCVAWRQQAEFLGKYFKKGSRLAIVGSLQSRSYEDTNTKKKVYVTEVIVDEIEFVDSKHDSQTDDASSTPIESYATKSQGKSADKQYATVAAPSYFDVGMDDDTTLPFDL